MSSSSSPPSIEYVVRRAQLESEYTGRLILWTWNFILILALVAWGAYTVATANNDTPPVSPPTNSSSSSSSSTGPSSPCSPNPCQNNASCIVNATRPLGFMCNCTSPLQTQPLCEIVVCDRLNQTLLWNVAIVPDTSTFFSPLAFTPIEFASNNRSLLLVEASADGSQAAQFYSLYDADLTSSEPFFDNVLTSTSLATMSNDPATLMVTNHCKIPFLGLSYVCVQVTGFPDAANYLYGATFRDDFKWCHNDTDTVFEVVGASFVNDSSPLHVVVTVQYLPTSWVPTCNCTTPDNCLIRAYTAEYEMAPSSAAALVRSVRVPGVDNATHVLESAMVVINQTNWIFFLYSNVSVLVGSTLDDYFNDSTNLAVVFDPENYFGTPDTRIVDFSFRNDASGDSAILVQLPALLGGEKVIVMGRWNGTTILIHQVVPPQTDSIPMDLYTPNTTTSIQYASWGEVFASQSITFEPSGDPMYFVLRCGTSNPCIDTPCSSGQTCTPALPTRICT